MSEILHHIAITVSDVEASANFYQKAFGFKSIPRLSESHSKNPGAWLQIGNFELHLQGRASAPERTEQHFALITNQLNEICESVPRYGGKVEPARLLDGFSARCFIYDLDKNKIELLQK